MSAEVGFEIAKTLPLDSAGPLGSRLTPTPPPLDVIVPESNSSIWVWKPLTVVKLTISAEVS